MEEYGGIMGQNVRIGCFRGEQGESPNFLDTQE